MTSCNDITILDPIHHHAPMMSSRQVCTVPDAPRLWVHYPSTILFRITSQSPPMTSGTLPMTHLILINHMIHHTCAVTSTLPQLPQTLSRTPPIPDIAYPLTGSPGFLSTYRLYAFTYDSLRTLCYWMLLLLQVTHYDTFPIHSHNLYVYK
jgi:hypothetical protein